MAKITHNKFLEFKRRLRKKKKVMICHGVWEVLWQCRKKIHLTGRAHRLYKVVASLETSFDEHCKSDALGSAPVTTINKEVCNQCLPILSCYKFLDWYIKVHNLISVALMYKL